MTEQRRASELEWVVDDLQVDSGLLGRPWRLLIQRPDSPVQALPWLWLLHGRTESVEDLRTLLAAVAASLRVGDLPPLVIAAPDAPEGHRTNWWVDSAFTPSDEHPDLVHGLPLETALLDEVRPAVEARYGGPAGPAERFVGGISMGGAAALRWVVVRRDLFGSAVLLSPGVFADLPVAGSTARRRDVVDVEGDLFDTDRYAALLHYPTLLAGRPPQNDPPARVVTVVGDEELVRTGPAGRHDLDLEAARLHAALKTRPDFVSALRVIDGGHDLAVWERGVVIALRILAGRATD